MIRYLYFIFFFFNETATTEIYTLSLHDALPISGKGNGHRAGSLPTRCPRRRTAQVSASPETPGHPPAAIRSAKLAALQARARRRGGCGGRWLAVLRGGSFLPALAAGHPGASRADPADRQPLRQPPRGAGEVLSRPRAHCAAG